MFQPKSEHIGAVGGLSNLVEVTLTLDTNAYADGDLLANATEIPNAVRGKGQTAILQSVTVHDKDDQAQALDLCFTTVSTSWGTLNAAAAPTDAVAASVQHIVSVAAADYVDLANGQIACKTNIGAVLESGASDSLYVAAVSRGTGTYTASGIVLKIGLLLD